MDMLLQRRPVLSGAARNDEIEVLRAVGVLMVGIGHIPFNLFNWHSALGDFLDGYWQGDAGIDLFLAISGYVIAQSLLPALAVVQTPPDFVVATARFWVRRFWRVAPAGFVWLVIPVLLSLVFNVSGAFRDPHANLASALSAMLGFNNFRLAGLYGAGDAGVTFPYWVLSLEMQFYLLLPVIVFLSGRWLAWVVGALAVLQFFIPDVPALLFTRTGALAFGVLLALWRGTPSQIMCTPVFLARGPAIRVAFMAVTVLLIGALQSSLPQPVKTLPFAISALLCAVLVHAASYGSGYIMGPGLARRVAVWLGTRSFALFVVHVPAYAVTQELYVRLRPSSLVHPLQMQTHLLIVAAVIALVAAELTYRHIEWPCRQYGRALATRLAA